MSNQVPAVGTIPLPSGYAPQGGDDPVSAMRKDLDALAARLAPASLMLAQKFQALAANRIATINVPSGYNGIKSCLTAGTINIYFGPSVGSVPDMQFTATGNPVDTFFPIRNDTQVTFQVDAASTAAATGNIYLMAY
jgi:hypothetical protein